MFDIAPTELMLVAVVALVVIGPKDLPKAMRFVGHWVSRARGVMNQFRSGFDAMVREAELQDMEKKWAAENERIMREHADPLQMSPTTAEGGAVIDHLSEDGPSSMVAAPAMIESPTVAPPAEPQFALEAEPVPPKAPKPRKPRAKKVDPSTEPGAAS